MKYQLTFKPKTMKTIEINDEFPKGSTEWVFSLGKDFANDIRDILKREGMYGANVYMKLYNRPFPGHADYRIEASDAHILLRKQTKNFPNKLDFRSFVLSGKDASILSKINCDITIRAMQGESGFFETLIIYSDNFTYNCHPLKEYFPDVFCGHDKIDVIR